MADTYYSNVSLLLHCNGSDGSTTFTDSGPAAHSVTAAGSAQIDTAQSKYGGASGRFDGSVTNDYLSVPNASSLDLSSGDFTIEAWVRCEFDASSWGTGDIVLQDKSSGTYAPWFIFLQDSGSGTYEVGFEAVNGSDSAVVSLLHGTGFADGTWVHVAVTRSGNTFRLFVDGASPVSSSSSATLKTSTAALLIGAGHAGWLDDVRITKGVARYTAAFTPPTAEFEEGVAAFDARIAENTGPLSTSILLLASASQARVQVSSMLGAALLFATDTHALLAAASPLGAFSGRAHSDFTPGLAADALQFQRYVLDLITPGGTVRVPMSSWQSTQQTDSQCYAGAVIPACAAYVDDLAEATEFVISRVATLAAGGTMEIEIVRSPLDTLQIDQGPTNHTASISGYTDAIDPDADPPEVYDRTLQGVRSISNYASGARVRCAIDWLLRPAMRAHYASTSMVVSYMNLYVTQNARSVEAYMDVGERVS